MREKEESDNGDWSCDRGERDRGSDGGDSVVWRNSNDNDDVITKLVISVIRAIAAIYISSMISMIRSLT